MQQRFIDAVYSNHNRAERIQSKVRILLQELGPNDLGLNVGAGQSRLHARMINLDLVSSPSIDCVGRAEQLPFRNGVFSLVVTQETLEHVRDPFQAVRDMYRVLRSEGVLYCQVPFIIGYHPGPTDYWRFTQQGIRELVEQAGFACMEVDVAVGPAVGFHRIATEFLASSIARIVPRLYLPAKRGSSTGSVSLQVAG